MKKASFSEPTLLAQDPPLWVVDDFLSPDECDAFLALFGDENFAVAHADHYGFDDTGFSGEWPSTSHPLLLDLEKRLERCTGVHSAFPMTFRFRYYQEGQGHPGHTDTYAIDRYILGITILICVCEPEAGGETFFPKAIPSPVAVEPRNGRLLAWASTFARGIDNPRSFHQGEPVKMGAKGVLLGFYYLEAQEHGRPLVLRRG